MAQTGENTVIFGYLTATQAGAPALPLAIGLAFYGIPFAGIYIADRWLKWLQKTS